MSDMSTIMGSATGYITISERLYMMLKFASLLYADTYVQRATFFKHQCFEDAEKVVFIRMYNILQTGRYLPERR